jgi:cobalt-zinc-cadmium efflux system protein
MCRYVRVIRAVSCLAFLSNLRTVPRPNYPSWMSSEHTSGASSGGHDHSAMFAANERALRISLWLTGIYFFVELGLGIASGSVAVLSDAMHTFSAVGGVLLALVANRIAARPSTRYRTFGSIRAEIVGALLNGLFLMAMAGVVIFMGVRRLLNPADLNTSLMLMAAVGGIITELISLRVLFKGQKDNLNMRGAYWHVIQTFVGSLLIVVAAVVVSFTDFVAIDPILGIAFGFVLVWASLGITRDSIRVLMETVPTDVDLAAVISGLQEIGGVRDTHHVHAWALTTGRNLFSAHIRVGDAVDPFQVLAEARSMLSERFGFYFSTVQIETECQENDPASAIDFADPPSTDAASDGQVPYP